MLTPEQYINRLSGLGGSDVGAICGESRWGTPLSVYQSKTSDKTRAELLADYHNQFESGKANIGIIGNLLEQSIKNLYTFETGHEIVDDEKTHRHPEHDFLIGHVDGWIKGTNTLIECKSAYIEGSDYGEQDTSEVPSSYYLQCAHYRMITGADSVVIAVLFGNHTFKTFKYEKNEKLEEGIRKIGVDFWHNHVLAKTPPKASNYSEASSVYQAQDKQKIVSDEVLDMVEELQSFKSKQKEMSLEIDNIQTKIANFMETANLLVDQSGNKILKWSEVKTNRFNSKKLKEENPEIYNSNLVQSVHRRMQLINSWRGKNV